MRRRKSFSMEFGWGSAPYPGIYRAGASPETGYRQRYPGRFGAGPWIGARVASQRCPVFRPGPLTE